MKKSKEFYLENAKQIAISRGGRCLSTVYVRSSVKLEFQCSEMHHWFAPYHRVQRGSWCRKCEILNRKKTIEDCHELAKARNGKCLSTVYVNSKDNLEWQCEEQHQWQATYRNVNRGSWCRKCDILNRRNTLEDCHELAKARNGECLSTVYVGSQSPLEWKCAHCHKWETAYNNVQSGKWCRFCAGMIVTIEDCHKIAHSRNGKCLSTVYVNSTTALEWQCEYNHKWETAYNNLQSGRWCPKCAGSRGENFCRYIFETIFEKRFPNIRPPFLKTKEHKRRGLELDGFCKDLNLAFEHQGRQHYEFVERFHRTEEGFKNQLKRDQVKRDLCEKNNVMLIEIPDIWDILKIQDVPDFIVNELQKLNIKVENPFKGKDIMEEYYKASQS